jgi:hypothetical protein
MTLTLTDLVAGARHDALPRRQVEGGVHFFLRAWWPRILGTPGDMYPPPHMTCILLRPRILGTPGAGCA